MFLLARIGWRNIWRQPRRTMITVGAMAIGVMFCLTMIALTDGIYSDLFDRIVTRSLGHAQVHHPEYPKKRAMWETVTDADELLAELEALPDVQHATARLFGYALLGFEDRSTGSQLIGVVPGSETAMTSLADRVVEGSYLSDTPSRELVMGEGLARKLRLSIGDEVVAVTQAADGSTGNDLYTVVGIFKTGSVILDRSASYTHMEDLRELLVLPGQAHEIALQAASREVIDPMIAAAGPISEAHGGQVRSWALVSPQLAQMMEMADASGIIMMVFIFSLAALGILNTMLMSVFERTKELGVIRALGLRPRQMVTLVMFESFALATVACLVGVPLGLAGDAYLVFHGLDMSGLMEGYSILGVNYEPLWMGEFNADKVVQVVIGLFVISFMAAIWPAIRVARLKPVDAMRQE